MPATTETLSGLVRQASSRRRDEHRTETREAIFSAAAELLGEAGYDGFSLRRLAARIRYTPTTVYRHFADKDDLVGAVLLEGYAAFTRALEEAADSAADPFEQLEAMGQAYVDFALARPVMYRVLFMQRPDLWQRIPPGRVEAACGAYALQLLVSAVQRAVATGRSRTHDAEATALALWALIHGVVSLCLALPHMAQPEAREQLLRGAFALADLGSPR